MENNTTTVWILYYSPDYSLQPYAPKFGGVFSSKSLAEAAAKDRVYPFITIHTMDKEEF